MFVGRVQVNVAEPSETSQLRRRKLYADVNSLGSHSGGDAELELLGFLKEVRCEITWVERSGNKDVGLRKLMSPPISSTVTHVMDLFLEDAVRSFLIVGHDEPVRGRQLTFRIALPTRGPAVSTTR
jgi:hypothetical protein